jgi:hypothetical protein
MLPTIPANPEALNSGSLDPRVVPFAEQIDKILPPEVGFRPPVAEALNRGIQQLMNSETTRDQILTAMQEAQEGS